MSDNECSDLLRHFAALCGLSADDLRSALQAIVASDPSFWEQAMQKVLDAARDLPPLPQYQMGGYVRPAEAKPYARRYRWGGPKDER